MTWREIEDWAGNAPASRVLDPGEALELTGVAEGQLLPSEEFNYLMRQLFRRSAMFRTLDKAAEVTDVGDVVTVNEYEPDRDLLSTRWQRSPAGAFAAYAVKTDGHRVYVGTINGTGNNCFAMDRISGVVLWQREFPLGITAIGVRGDVVWVAEDSANGIIHKLDPEDGTDFGGSWSNYTHGAGINSIVADENHVYIGGASGTGTITHRALDEETGAAVWSQNHGATVTQLLIDNIDFADAGAIFLTGVNSSNVAMRRIRRDTGAALGTPNTFDHGDDLNCIAQSAHHLYVAGEPDGGFLSIKCLAKHDFSVVWSNGFGAGVPINVIEYDGRMVYLAVDDTGSASQFWALDARAGEFGRSIDLGLSGSEIPRDLATDGFGLFLATTNTGAGDDSVFRLHIQAQPQLAYRALGSERGLFPWAHKMVPCGIWEW